MESEKGQQGGVDGSNLGVCTCPQQTEYYYWMILQNPESRF